MIYVASKAIHGDYWKAMRDSGGMPINSTWINEHRVGQTKDWSELWVRIFREIEECKVLIAYQHTPQEELRGGRIEIGAALAYGKPVIVVGMGQFSFVHHPRVIEVRSLDEAFNRALYIINQGG